MNWNKITLYKFQRIEEITNRPGLSELDKTLFSTCIVFDKTEHQLDNLGIKKVDRLASKVAKIFSSEFNPVASKRLGKWLVEYNISNLSFGQYIELAFFLSGNTLNNTHYALASVTRLPFGKNKASQHRGKSEGFLKLPIQKAMGCMAKIVESFTKFNKEYSSLFGLDKEVTGDVQEDKFNKRYGWIYSAEQVALYERISLEEAFKLPVRQAFNDLAYLKAKSKYEAEQLKQANNGR